MMMYPLELFVTEKNNRWKGSKAIILVSVYFILPTRSLNSLQALKIPCFSNDEFHLVGCLDI